jgi:hypothetical protein
LSEIAMPVEMVGRDVDEKADAWPKRRRKVDLIGRTLDHMRARARRRRQIENRHTDVAAHRDLASRFLEHMRDERGRRRFAVGPSDGDERRIRRSRAALADKELDIADNRNPGRVREIDRPVRLGMGQWHAGGQHKHPKAAPVGVSEIDQGNACGRSALTCGLVVVPGGDCGPPSDKRPRGR